MLLLQRVARTYSVTAEVIEFVANAYPSGIYMTDNYGLLPFHHGVLNFEAWDGTVISTLLQLYPEAVAQK